jgi:hypothetical protein
VLIRQVLVGTYRYLQVLVKDKFTHESQVLDLRVQVTRGKILVQVQV